MLEDLHKLLGCKDDNALQHEFSRSLKNLGVTNFAYLRLTHLSNAKPTMISTYPKQWIEKYCNNHYQRIDPTVLLCHKLNTPFSWQLGRQLPGEDIAQYWEEAANFKLAYGVSIPLEKTTLHSAGIGISLDTSDDTQWLAEHQTAINVLCHLFHFKLNQLQSSAEHNIQKFGLSVRELECAHWLCSGLSLALIAENMSITERTVRFHLNQLKSKLNCKNKEQVIARLISLKLVQV